MHCDSFECKSYWCAFNHASLWCHHQTSFNVWTLFNWLRACMQSIYRANETAGIYVKYFENDIVRILLCAIVTSGQLSYSARHQEHINPQSTTILRCGTLHYMLNVSINRWNVDLCWLSTSSLQACTCTWCANRMNPTIDKILLLWTHCVMEKYRFLPPIFCYAFKRKLVWMSGEKEVNLSQNNSEKFGLQM